MIDEYEQSRKIKFIMVLGLFLAFFLIFSLWLVTYFQPKKAPDEKTQSEDITQAPPNKYNQVQKSNKIDLDPSQLPEKWRNLYEKIRTISVTCNEITSNILSSIDGVLNGNIAKEEFCAGPGKQLREKLAQLIEDVNSLRKIKESKDYNKMDSWEKDIVKKVVKYSVGPSDWKKWSSYIKKYCEGVFTEESLQLIKKEIEKYSKYGGSCSMWEDYSERVLKYELAKEEGVMNAYQLGTVVEPINKDLNVSIKSIKIVKAPVVRYLSERDFNSEELIEIKRKVRDFYLNGGCEEYDLPSYYMEKCEEYEKNYKEIVDKYRNRLPELISIKCEYTYKYIYTDYGEYVTPTTYMVDILIYDKRKDKFYHGSILPPYTNFSDNVQSLSYLTPHIVIREFFDKNLAEIKYPLYIICVHEKVLGRTKFNKESFEVMVLDDMYYWIYFKDESYYSPSITIFEFIPSQVFQK